MYFEKCSESTKIEGDPECGTDAEINDYLDGKYIQVRNLVEKLDLSDYEGDPFDRSVRNVAYFSLDPSHQT